MNASRDRVLVVEEPNGRDELQLGLEMVGYQVDVANGEAALIVVAARTPAVTTRNEPEERDRSRAAGFDTDLVKPVSPNRAHRTLRQLLAH